MIYQVEDAYFDADANKVVETKFHEKLRDNHFVELLTMAQEWDKRLEDFQAVMTGNVPLLY